MKKRLSVLGNSYAVIIDKPIRAVLGIGRETILHVSTDGRRIVIEPTTERHRPVITGTELDARRVFDTLVRHYGLCQQQFDELSPTKLRLMRYRGGLETETFTDDERTIMRRLAVCLPLREREVPWDDAIREALEEVPALAA